MSTEDNNPLLSDRKKKLIKNLRFVNIAVAILVVVLSITASIFVIISAIATLKIFLIASPVFNTIFALSLLAAEFKVRFILKKMPFLKTPLGKGLFYLYLSSVIYYYFYAAEQEFLGYVGGFALMASAILYLLIHFGCFRGITQEDLEDQYEEDYKQRLI